MNAHAQPTKIYIATPLTGGIVKMRYYASVLKMIQSFETARIPRNFSVIDACNLPEQRDALADQFLRSNSSHLLFIDSDMSFEPDLWRHLLSFEKDFVSTICAKRLFSFERMKKLLDDGVSFEDARSMAHDFNIGSPPQAKEGDLYKVRSIGMAFVLISKGCFEQITEKGELKEYDSSVLPGHKVRGFFQHAEDNQGRPLAEDHSFCRRWRRAGGTVWAYADPKIKHIGDMEYGAPFYGLKK
jgi:hypothetical protein